MANTARILNVKSIENQLVEAFLEWAEDDVNGEYWAEQFFTNKWPYPSQTKRRNGETAGPGPRNIVDTQELYDSGVESMKLSKSSNGASADWHWNAKNSTGDEYAWYVHEGQGPHSLEPRRWTDELSSEYLFGNSRLKRQLMDKIQSKLNA